MWRRVLVSIAVVATCVPANGAARRRAAGEELIQVVAPTSRAVAGAHPHVNVILSFGAAKDGTPAEPSTFRAKLNGKVAIKWVITANGTVASANVAQSTVNDATMETCLASRVRTWQFPKPKGGGVVIVTYPFIFKQSGE